MEQDIQECVVEAIVELAGMFDILRQYGLISRRQMRQMVGLSSKMGVFFLEVCLIQEEQNE